MPVYLLHSVVFFRQHFTLIGIWSFCTSYIRLVYRSLSLVATCALPGHCILTSQMMLQCPYSYTVLRFCFSTFDIITDMKCGNFDGFIRLCYVLLCLNVIYLRHVGRLVCRLKRKQFIREFYRLLISSQYNCYHIVAILYSML